MIAKIIGFVQRSPSELSSRLIQRGAAAIERLGLTAAGEVPLGSPLTPALPFPILGRDHLCATLARLPGAAESILGSADRIASGRFDLLGYKDLDFGNPVDWHLDPVNGRHAPILHWSRVPHLDPDIVGDHKVIWELNRQQFLVSLAQAWTLTGDRRHADAFVLLVEGWLAANPPKLGINWASSLELAFRAIAWTWALHLLGEEIPETLRIKMARSLDLHGRHIERYLSTWFSPNTHLTGEALGLLYLGTAWPGLRRANRWKRLGWRILCEQLAKQLRPDGTYFEQSSWYHGYTVDFYLHALQLAELGGQPVPAGMRERVGAAAGVLAALARPDGTIPLIGDDDGGRLLPLAGWPTTGFGDTLAHAAMVLGRPELTEGIAVPPSVVWLTGRLPEPVPPSLRGSARGGSQAFSDGGWYVSRDRSGPLGIHLVIDAGPHGALTGAHAHADALSVSMDVGGKPLLADPGSGRYLEPERNLFRGTAWHSTLTLPGMNSAEPAGQFRWRTFPNSEIGAWEVGAGFAWFDGWHDGWSRVVPGLRHRRSLLHLNGLGVVVVDRLRGADRDKAPAAEIRWHCAAGITAVATGQGRVGLSREGRLVATLVSEGGPVELEAGRTSRCYGSAEDSVIVVVRPAPDSLVDGIATAILPGADGQKACLGSGLIAGARVWDLVAGDLTASLKQSRSGLAWQVRGGGQSPLPMALDLLTNADW